MLRWAVFNSFLLGGDPEDLLIDAIRFEEGDYSTAKGRSFLMALVTGLMFRLTGSEELIIAKIIPFISNVATIPLTFILVRLLGGCLFAAFSASLALAFSPLSISDSNQIEARGLFSVLILLFFILLTSHSAISNRLVSPTTDSGEKPRTRRRAWLNEAPRAGAFLCAILAWYTYIMGGAAVGVFFLYLAVKGRKSLPIYLILLIVLLYNFPFDITGGSYTKDFAGESTGIFSYVKHRIEIYLSAVIYWHGEEFDLGRMSAARILSLFVFMIPIVYFASRRFFPGVYLILFLLPYAVFSWTNAFYMTPALPFLYAFWFSGVSDIFKKDVFLRYAYVCGGLVFLLAASYAPLKKSFEATEEEVKSMHVYYCMNLPEVMNKLESSIPPDSAVKVVSFRWEYTYFLRDFCRIIPPESAFPKNFIAGSEEERIDFYEQSLFRRTDFLALDNAGGYSICSMTDEIYNDLIRMIEESGFSASFEIKELFEIEGYSVTDLPKKTTVYEVKTRES